MDKYDIRQLREMLELGQAVAREILSESSYSGRAATYWNGELGTLRSSRLALFAEGNLERLRELTERAAPNGNE